MIWLIFKINTPAGVFKLWEEINIWGTMKFIHGFIANELVSPPKIGIAIKVEERVWELYLGTLIYSNILRQMKEASTQP